MGNMVDSLLCLKLCTKMTIMGNAGFVSSSIRPLQSHQFQELNHNIKREFDQFRTPFSALGWLPSAPFWCYIMDL